MRRVLENEGELNARVFQFPTSAIKLGGRKINYYDFINNAEYTGCNAALLRIVPSIDLQGISDFIDQTPYLSETHRESFIRFIFLQDLKSYSCRRMKSFCRSRTKMNRRYNLCKKLNAQGTA